MIITVYTTPICQQCTATKRWLDRRGIPYAVVDVTTSPTDAAAIKALGYKTAPVVIISNGDPETDIHWDGFNPTNLARYAGSPAT